MKQLTVENLRCVTSSERGRDELRFELDGDDGGAGFIARRRMRDGDDWAVDGSVVYDRSCTVRLFEEDFSFPGRDEDSLGVVEIGAADVERAEAVIESDGARYVLVYSVEEWDAAEEHNLADRAAELFERSGAAGLWQAIDKSSLLDNVRRRRDDADEIDQVKSNFCGPTSVAHELARTQPRRYVELCRQLYETGGFWSRTKRVEAGEHLRTGAVGQGMAPADWMLIATMRDAENALFKVDADATGILSGLQGMTFPWEIKGWAREILLKDDVDVDLCVVFGELDAIRKAQEVYDRGGSAFLLVNMAVLKKGERPIPPFPDHWVVFRGGLDLSDADERVAFDVYSWGRIIPLDLPRKRFEKALSCVVTAV